MTGLRDLKRQFWSNYTGLDLTNSTTTLQNSFYNYFNGNINEPKGLIDAWNTFLINNGYSGAYSLSKWRQFLADQGFTAADGQKAGTTSQEFEYYEDLIANGIFPTFQGMTGIYSLDQFSTYLTDVDRTRRNSDDSEQDFSSPEINNSSLLNFVVPTNIQALYSASAYFDGVNDFFYSTTGSDFSAKDWTLTVTFFTNDVTSQQDFFAQQDGAGIGRSWLRVGDTSGALDTFIGGSQSILKAGLEDKTLYTVTLTRDNATGDITGTIDGGSFDNEALNTVSPTMESATGVFRIGAAKSSTAFFNGVVLDVNLNDEHAWTLDGVSGTALEDTIGSNDLTASGSPLLFTGQDFHGRPSTVFDQTVPTSQQRMYWTGGGEIVSLDSEYEMADGDTLSWYVYNENAGTGTRLWRLGAPDAQASMVMYTDGFSTKDLAIRTNSIGYDFGDATHFNSNQLYFCELVRSGTTYSFYIDEEFIDDNTIPDTANDTIKLMQFGDTLNTMKGTIFDVKITNGGSLVHHWPGYGNTDADWVDQVGSNDGTISSYLPRFSAIDYSTVSKDFIQETSANQPYSIEDGQLITINDKPALKCDGTNTLMLADSDDYSATDEFTVAIVTECAVSDITSEMDIIGQYGNSNRCWAVDYNDAEKIKIKFGDPADGSYEGDWISDDAISVEEPHLVTVFYNTGTVTVYLDGVEISGTSTNVPSTLFQSTSQLSLGASESGSNPYNGKVAVALVSDTDLSADADEINQLLLAKWGFN